MHEGRGFKRDSSGRLLYFPHGAVSVGRVVPRSCEKAVKAAAAVAQLSPMVALTILFAVADLKSLDFNISLLIITLWSLAPPFLISAGMEATEIQVSRREMQDVAPSYLTIEVFLTSTCAGVLYLRFLPVIGNLFAAVVTISGLMLIFAFFYWRPIRSGIESWRAP